MPIDPILPHSEHWTSSSAFTATPPNPQPQLLVLWINWSRTRSTVDCGSGGVVVNDEPMFQLLPRSLAWRRMTQCCVQSSQPNPEANKAEYKQHSSDLYLLIVLTILYLIRRFSFCFYLIMKYCLFFTLYNIYSTH